MPVPGFLASFADKAQSAINASPLAAHLPSAHGSRPPNPEAAAQSSSNDQSAPQGGLKSHTLESISNQLRAFSQQYSSTSPVQKIITAEKGVSIAFDSVARDSKFQSKELYVWGQTETQDIQDVTDRLAYLNFVQGSLAGSLAHKLNAARAPLKALRDAENAIAPRRNFRTGLQNQLAKVEHDQQRGYEKKIAELKEQIRKAEMDDQAQEREIEILKRKAVKDSEVAKWEAVREYGEKLILISQAATPIIAALPALPPTPVNPYTGAQATGVARASLQRALDNYKTGHVNLLPQSASSLGRSDTCSFGESHASELSHMDIPQPSMPTTTPSTTLMFPQPLHQQIPLADKAAASPINPSNLNQTPTPIPTTTAAANAPDAVQMPTGMSNPFPTVAETGMPVVAGPSGPGPAVGSLHDLKETTSNATPKPGPVLSHVEVPQTGAAIPADVNIASSEHHETAEVEKKRLEREERERLLREGENEASAKKQDDELPPYQEI
ncbi:hypothetical protein AX17_000518 [Amanita inopinata Kibby_2008]|nr:hypothetical protein AX17_000518 [Amanita inopinata Kibby_2008]